MEKSGDPYFTQSYSELIVLNITVESEQEGAFVQQCDTLLRLKGIGLEVLSVLPF
jgi:hypothetical protein